METVSAWLPGWLAWLSWLLVPLFVLASLLVIGLGFSLLANLIAAPFNGLLAEAIERRLHGEAPIPIAWRSLPAEALASLGSELRKLGYFLVRAIPTLVLFLIPVLQVAAPFVWMTLSAWLLALAFADYPMANHGLRFPEQRARLSRRRWLGLGFGAAVTAGLLVPGLNLFVIPAAVAGATALWVEQLSDPSNRGSERDVRRGADR